MDRRFAMKRLFSLLLSFFLVLTLLPVTALAETGGVTTETELRDAVANAGDGDIISIDADITLMEEPYTLTLDKNITLTSANGSTLNVGNQATSKIAIAAGVSVTFSGDLAVEGGQYYLIDVLGTFTLTGSASVERSNVSGAGAVYAHNGGIVNIEGGSVTETYSSGNGVKLGDNSSVLNMNGGEISGNVGVAVMSTCTANISGGTISGNPAVNVGTNATVNISGGTFTGVGVTAIQSAGAANIAGGTFAGNVRTGTSGTINVDTTSGNVSFSNGVSFSQSGTTRSFLSALPGPVNMEAGGSETITLQGVYTGVAFSINGEPPAGLAAEISDNTVTLNPMVPGTYSLVLTAHGLTTEGTTNASQLLKLTIPVTVTGSALAVCEIGEIQYETLDEALAEVEDSQTIKLLDNITDTDGISITSGRTFDIDLNGHTLNVSNSGYLAKALEVTNGSEVGLDDSATGGAFNVSGTYGVYADHATVTVSSAMSSNWIAVAAYNNANVTVTGNAEGSNRGIDAENSCVITVYGDVKSTGDGMNAIQSYDGTVHVYGNAISSGGGTSHGILGSGNITVDGDVEGSQVGVSVSGPFSVITVGGNVTARGTDDASATPFPFLCYGAEASQGEIKIGGNITASNCTGAFAAGGGTITVDGTITAATYTKFAFGLDTVIKTINDKRLPTTKEGYFTYTDNNSAVWVKDNSAPPASGAPPVRIAAGPEHTLFLKQDGTVWSWGYNDRCQLGYGPSGNGRLIPDRIEGLSDIVSIDTGHQHALALDENGDVWIWGGNEFGQQGNGFGVGGLQATPTKVSGLSDVKAIAAGWAHSLALKEDGTLWAWGYNAQGQLGDGSETTRTSPVQVMTDVAAISAGNHHSLVLKNDGTVWAWGGNGDGQLGDGTTAEKTSPQRVPGLTGVSRVYASGHNSAALVGDDLFVWGDNNVGQLGDGTKGDGHDRNTIGTALLDEVEDFSGSGLGGFFIAKAGSSVYVWGYNGDGQLGNGTNNESLTPTVSAALSAIDIQAFAVAERSSHCLAIDDEGTLWSWGYNNMGQLGDGSQDNSNVPVRVQFPGTPPPTGDAEWHCRSPLPTPNYMQNVKYLGGKYMAVGYNGTLITSDDGETWQTVDVGTDVDLLSGIAYGEGKYVIVGYADSSGYAARIYTSDNGLNWHETAAVPHHRFNDVVYGNGQFLAVGQAGKIFVSDDGENWDTIAVDPMDYTPQSVTYADGKYVAAGGWKHTGIPYRGGIMTSVDGVSWSVTYTHGTSTMWDVTYGEGVFVAVGGRSDQAGSYTICTSADGTNWTSRSVAGVPTSTACFYSVDYDGSRFIAAGATNGTQPYSAYVAASEDGTVWTYRGNSAISSFRTVASNASGLRYVAMGGTGNIYTSDDGGTSWTCRTLGTTKNLRDITWNGSDLYVAVGDGGTIQSSPDGETWTIQTSGTTQKLNKIDYLNGQFIAVGANGTILTSTNGTSWTTRTSGLATVELLDIAFGEGTYIVGGNGAVRISTDGGINWTAPTGLITLKTVAYGNGGFVALSQYGEEFNSDGGQFWNNVGRLYQYSEYPTDMIYADGKFIAVGGYGKIFLSSDNGVNWTTVQSDLYDYLRAVAYGGGNLIAAAENGNIIASANGGTTWFLQPSGLTPNPHFSQEDNAELYGIAAGGDSFMAAGGNGLILQSEGFGISTDPDAHAVAYAKYELGFYDISGPGANGSPGLIVMNMNLTTFGDKGTSISWSSSKPEYIAADGTVTRPSFGAGDQVVYLTATISRGSASDTKTFIVDVIESPDTDAQTVANAKAALTFSVIGAANTAENNIVSNLDLVTTMGNGITVSWSSDKPAYIATNGAVTRPDAGELDQTVTLTATISKGSVSDTKTFIVVVIESPDTDAQTVANAKAALTFSVIGAANTAENNIVSNLNLVTTGANGTGISWASSKPEYITTGGAVTRPAQGTGDQVVILTATISKGSVSDTKTFTLTVKAASPSSPPGSTGSTGSTGGGDKPAALPAASIIDSAGKVSSTVTATLDSSTGTVKAEASSALLTDAFNQSKPDETGSKTIQIDIPEISGAEVYASVLPASFLASGDTTRAVEVKTALATVTVSGSMLDAVNASGAHNVTLSIAAGDRGKLDAAVQAQIGERPVIELSLKIDEKQTSWSNENAPVTVTIPYTPTAEELNNPESIIIWYIDGDGNAHCVPNGRYDPAAGTVTFTTTHFSLYAVGWNPVLFGDVATDAWYSEAVSFLAARGITYGTENGNYNPEGKLTRGQFLVMLMRACGISPDENPTDNFADAGSTYYTNYLASAKRLGISNGVGDNLFAPEKAITRQEMFTLLYNAQKGIGRLPKGDSGRTLSNFTDVGQIASWAKDAMEALVKDGIISGNDGKLNPTSTTTRAEMAQVLYNLLFNIG